MIADYEGDISNLLNTNVLGEVPILTTRNLVVFPGVVSPILVGREASVKLIKHLDKHPDTIFCIFCQRDSNVDNPVFNDLYTTGVYAKVVKVIEMPGPGNNLTAIVQGLGRCMLESLTKMKPFFAGIVSPNPEQLPSEKEKEFITVCETVKKSAKEYIGLNEDMPDEAQFALSSIQNKVVTINYVCSTLPFSIKDKMKLLEIDDTEKRAYSLLKILDRETQLLKLKQEIRQKTRMDLDEQQREYFLQQQIKNIKEELGHGDGSPEHRELLEKAKDKKWNEEVATAFYKELDKLELYNPQSPEYSVQLNYLQNMVNLPWGVYTKDDLNLKKAERVLNHDHYGMEKVKERILEYISVLKLRGDLKSPILCLYGPPGVGKTSLGKSIAEAMNRKYVRMSLGGLHDESEIRGHRRTYIGAMPGRIMEGLRKAGTKNPVFLLDEVDKIAMDYKGDPSAALLEVLDPAQNTTFSDHYVELPFDLSEVLWIVTANSLANIPRALRDRMEIIMLSSYTEQEKLEIAKRYLVGRQRTANGLKARDLQFGEGVIEKMIVEYTRESGVRELERTIGHVCRKAARLIVEGEKKSVRVTKKNIRDFLERPKFLRKKAEKKPEVGVATGMAWTEVGGDILPTEVTVLAGKGKLILTGQLGDVMQESACAGLSYIRSR